MAPLVSWYRAFLFLSGIGVCLFAPLSLAQYGSPSSGGAPKVLPVIVSPGPYSSNTPDISKGIKPVEHPDGPKCDPGVAGCDISASPTGLLRDIAEGDNELEAFFWDGVMLVSPIWKGTGDVSELWRKWLSITNNRDIEYGIQWGEFLLNERTDTFMGFSLRRYLDDLLKNLTATQLFAGDEFRMDEFEKGISRGSVLESEYSENIDFQTTKTAPGLLPFGHQYELREEIANAMKRSLEETKDQRRYTPSYKYLIVQTGDPDHPWANDLDRPLFSDQLERQLRLVKDYKFQTFFTGTIENKTYPVYGNLFQRDATASLGDGFKGRTYTEAIHFCAAKGGRLPNFNELTLVFMDTYNGADLEPEAIYLTHEYIGANVAVNNEFRVLSFIPSAEKIFGLNVHTDGRIRHEDVEGEYRDFPVYAMCIYK